MKIIVVSSGQVMSQAQMGALLQAIDAVDRYDGTLTITAIDLHPGDRKYLMEEKPHCLIKSTSRRTPRAELVDLALAADLVLACPKRARGPARSGTAWLLYRAVNKRNRPCKAIYPD